jgi:hypothetical protein
MLRSALMHLGGPGWDGSLRLLPACWAASQHAAPARLRTSFLGGTTAPRAQELKLQYSGCAALIPQVLAQPSMPRLRVLDLGVDLSCGSESFAPLWAAPWFS